MENKVNKSTALYYLMIFLMPFAALIGLLILQSDLLNLTGNIIIKNADYKIIITSEVAVFLISWVTLFVSYFMHLFNKQIVKIVIVIFGCLFFISISLYSVNIYKSFADMIYPIMIVTPTIVSIACPISESAINNRKNRIKNTIKKSK